MVTSLTRIACPLALTALLALGCGGKSFKNGDDESSGGSASGGSASGGTGQGGGRAVSGGGSGGAPVKCDPLLNQSGPQLTLLLRNGTPGPIYIGPQKPTCGLGGDVYQVTDSAGRLLERPTFCNATCQNLYQGTVATCPPVACPVSAVIALQPGEAALQSWTAAFMTTAKLPEACWPPDGSTSCQYVESAKPGGYVFTAQAGTQIDCSQFGGACMQCFRDSNGGCTTAGAIIGGQLITAKLAVMLDASYGVGGPSGGGMPLPIEIVFGK